jgi:essential nuclear protein 1
MSINALDVAAALVKMTTYGYKLGNGYFMKVLICKRYTLPTIVLDSLINFFCNTGLQNTSEDPDTPAKEMPVMWHQTVLALVQCYKSYFSVEQRKKLLQLIKI